MNIKDYEDDFLDDESWDSGNQRPKKFRTPKEDGKYRNRNKKKQNIRKQREQKEKMRQRLDERMMEDGDED